MNFLTGSIINFIGSLIIGAIAGWLAGLIRKGEGFGVLGNIIVGLIGSFLGGLISPLLGIESQNFVGTLLVSTLGAVLFLFIVSLFKKS